MCIRDSANGGGGGRASADSWVVCAPCAVFIRSDGWAIRGAERRMASVWLNVLYSMAALQQAMSAGHR